MRNAPCRVIVQVFPIRAGDQTSTPRFGSRLAVGEYFGNSALHRFMSSLRSASPLGKRDRLRTAKTSSECG
jgi:hypothetical protein